MPSDEKGKNPPRKAGSQEARQKGKAPADRPFDMWLQKQLHAMYDEIAGEPLPNDLLDIIDRDAARSDDDAASKAKPDDKKS
ncbi:hypothetical protein [Reyranella sp.]|uniref:hypothetical protein n=1 Tax=Reyranella sp. TaxID=1929291 RepID=UPI003BA92EA9